MGIVEPGQLVDRKDHQRRVGEVVGAGNVALGVRRVGQEDERPGLDIRHAGGPRIGKSLLGLLARPSDVGDARRRAGEVAAPGVGSSSAARSNVLRAATKEPRRSARRPASSSASAAAPARSWGTAPSSSASSWRPGRGGRHGSPRARRVRARRPTPRKPGDPRRAGSYSAAVGDVADQDVLEAEGAIAGDRRTFLGDDEIPCEQRVETAATSTSGASRSSAPRQKTRPTRAAVCKHASRRRRAGRCAPRSTPAPCRGSACGGKRRPGRGRSPPGTADCPPPARARERVARAGRRLGEKRRASSWLSCPSVVRARSRSRAGSHRPRTAEHRAAPACDGEDQHGHVAE